MTIVKAIKFHGEYREFKTSYCGDIKFYEIGSYALNPKHFKVEMVYQYMIKPFLR